MNNLQSTASDTGLKKIISASSGKEEPLIDILVSRMLPRGTTQQCDAWLTGITIVFGIAYNVLGATNALLWVRIPFFVIHLLSYFIFFKRRALLTRTAEDEKVNLRKNIEDALATIDKKSVENAEAVYTKNYYKCMAEQYHILAKVIGKRWSKERTKRFYTLVLESIKQQVHVTIENHEVNLALNLYAYYPESNSIRRVATGSRNEAFENDARPFSEVKAYYYAKCIADNNREVFILDGHERIVAEFYVKDKTEIALYNQYIGVSICTVCGVKFFVEIIVIDNPVIVYDMEKLVRETVRPFDLYFKMIGSNLKNCV